ARRSGRSPEPGRFQLYRGPQARDRTFRVIRDDGVISVDGESVARLVRLTDMADDAAVMRLQNQLLKLGVEEALTKAGVEAGSEVVIAGQVFTFFPEMRADPVAERA
nr:Obg family GTPase CgtA [Candidatus Dormibacteraeota bacterium]